MHEVGQAVQVRVGVGVGAGRQLLLLAVGGLLHGDALAGRRGGAAGGAGAHAAGSCWREVGGHHGREGGAVVDQLARPAHHLPQLAQATADGDAAGGAVAVAEVCGGGASGPRLLLGRVLLRLLLLLRVVRLVVLRVRVGVVRGRRVALRERGEELRVRGRDLTTAGLARDWRHRAGQGLSHSAARPQNFSSSVTKG